MNRLSLRLVVGVLAPLLLLNAQDSGKKTETKVEVTSTPAPPPAPPPPPDSNTDGAVTVGGQVINYRAVAGTLTVGATDTYDATLGLDGKPLSDSGEKPIDANK